MNQYHDSHRHPRHAWRPRLVTRHLSPERIFILSFAAVILMGALLLWLPVSSGKTSVPWVDALFTSASAVCVTGLSTIQVGTDLSVAGQVVLILLFQVGGLGILTFSAVFFVLMGRGLASKEHDIMQSVFLYAPRRDLASILKFVLLSTFLYEGAGALLLWARFAQDFPPGDALFKAVFHAVSAFNNAGFSLFSDNLVSYQGDPIVNLTVMGLIVAGGVGFIVHYELHLRVFRQPETAFGSHQGGADRHRRADRRRRRAVFRIREQPDPEGPAVGKPRAGLPVSVGHPAHRRVQHRRHRDARQRDDVC